MKIYKFFNIFKKRSYFGIEIRPAFLSVVFDVNKKQYFNFFVGWVFKDGVGGINLILAGK